VQTGHEQTRKEKVELEYFPKRDVVSVCVSFLRLVPDIQKSIFSDITDFGWTSEKPNGIGIPSDGKLLVLLLKRTCRFWKVTASRCQLKRRFLF